MNSHVISEPPLCEVQAGLPSFDQSHAFDSSNDLAQVRGLGFDFARLTINWSQLEPDPGVYNTTYLDRIAQVVEWARQQGVRVLLDMHQDNYSRFTPETYPYQVPPAVTTTTESGGHADGAPPWAVVTDGEPPLAPFGQAPFNAFVEAAFTSFWLNRVPVDPATGQPLPQGQAPGLGLQDHYIGALSTLAHRFAAERSVVGYGVFNEPWPGFVAPPLFEDLLLFPFYRRVVDALTGAADGVSCPASWPAIPACGYPDLGIHDRHHLFFLEPDHLREQTDLLTHLPMPISSYGNLVYSIHAYTHKFTLDALAGQDPRRAGYPPGGFELSYASAEAEARAAGAALFVSEFGNEPEQDGLLLANQLRQQERHQVGGTLWPWKENCTLTTSWGVYEGVYSGHADQRCAYDRPPPPDMTPKSQNGCLRPGRERLLARVWPRATAGRIETYAYDPDSGGFQFRASGRAGMPDTVFLIPKQVRGAVSVSGAGVVRTLNREPDGSRLLRVAPQGGEYRVAVAPAQLALTSCPSTTT